MGMTLASLFTAGKFIRHVLARAGATSLPKSYSVMSFRSLKVSRARLQLFASILPIRSITDLNDRSHATNQRCVIVAEEAGVNSTSEVSEAQYVGERKNGKKHGQGRLTNSNGQIFQGEFRNDKFYNGICTILNNDDSVPRLGAKLYEGEFVNGNFHGEGKIVYANGTTLSGEFKKGHIINGMGTRCIGDGKVYNGEIRDGMISGHGEITNPDGTTLVGQFHQGKLCNGHGKKFNIHGTSYMGTWEDGKMTGFGRIFYADGGYWEGDFIDGAPWSGVGRLQLEDGRIYHGAWHNGTMYGEGRLLDMNKLKFGEFENGMQVAGNRRKVSAEDLIKLDQRILKHHSLSARGMVYTGERVNGLMHGEGTITDKHQRSWSGEFRHNKLYTGSGTVVLDNETIYTGAWLAGVMHGPGTCHSVQGKLKWAGEYVHGYRLPKIQTSPKATPAQFKLRREKIDLKRRKFNCDFPWWHDKMYKGKKVSHRPKRENTAYIVPVYMGGS